MKNIILHDSIHRVEPAARQQSEQLHKAETAQQGIEKNLRREMEIRQSSPGESEAPVSDRETGGEKNPKKRKGRNRKPDEKDASSQSRFLGGQLLDREA